MNNITENFNLENNFWDYTPQFKVVEPFKKLYDSDKSRGKKNSSNIMWAIALCYHPKSDLFNLKDKEDRVFDMVKDKSFKLKDYTVHIEEFKDMCLSQAEKSLVAWEDRLRSRDKFLEGQEYTFGYSETFIGNDGEPVERSFPPNTKNLDDMLARTGKLYDEYFKIKKELEHDETVKKGKGNKNLSESDRGDI